MVTSTMPVQTEDGHSYPCPLSLPNALEMPSEYPEDDANLVPCSSCNRTFNAKALERHEKVCQKVQSNKKVRDSTKKTSVGEVDDPYGSISKDRNRNSQIKKKSRWREKHAEFLKTIRAARTSDDSDEGSPQRVIPSDYIKCPHCERHFGPKAADRHMDWCEEQKNRLPRSHTNQDERATERLKTRTKYAPPKPGQNGWRAPKKKDVISSIPPSNIGANITPPGRLISPPPNSNRQFSPPPHINLSPPPVSPSRRGTLASLPPGPPRYGSTSSLGKSSGRQFSSMLQSMTGCPSGYGLSSGYGSSYLYGSPTTGSNFSRSASLRLPRKSPTRAKRMARHRDLASDMLSSVSVEGGKRQEPEGGEDQMDSRKSYENPSYKMDDAPYDPYSVAELQFQELLGLSKPGVGGLRSDLLMGSTNSLKGLGLTRDALERRDFSPQKRNLGTMSLCSFRLDGFDPLADELKSPVEDLSEAESLDAYSNGMQSPIDEFEDLLASLTTTINDESSKNDYNRRHDIGRNDARSRSVSSQSNHSPIRNHDSVSRVGPDGSHSLRKSSSPPYTHSPLRRSPPKDRFSPPYTYSPLRRSPSKERTPPYTYSPMRRSPSKEPSPPYQTSQTPTTGLKKNEGYTSTSSNNYGWMNTDYFGSSQNYSRHLQKTSPSDEYQTSKSYLNPRRSNAVLENKNFLSRFDDNEQRVSSGSSTDSSFPLLSPPITSNIQPLKRTISTNNNNSSASILPKFCYECGNKYPVSVAKFCCQCGAPRVTV